MKSIKFIAVSILGLLLLTCSIDPKRLEFETRNPIEYTFNATSSQVREAVNRCLSHLEYHDMYLNDGLKTSGSLDSIDIFEQSGNKLDFYLSPTHQTKLISKEYPGCAYKVSFHIHLTSIDSNRTSVKMIAINPRLVVGKELIPSPPHFKRLLEYEEVSPSTVEEYEILQIIGKCIGDKDMPIVKYPR